MCSKEKEELLSGMVITLVLALYRMLEIRLCRKKLPCFREGAWETAKTMFNEFWQFLTPKQQEEFRFRLIQCLYWRHLKFNSWADFQEAFDREEFLKDGLYDWCKSRNFKSEDSLILILRLLRRRKFPISSSEIRHCLSATDESAEDKAADIIFRLLLRGCHKVRISARGFKKLAVKYRNGEGWNIFPAA